jgi:mono/diheme cytochrome c family protein
MKQGTLMRISMTAIGLTAAMGFLLAQAKIDKKPIVYTPPENGGEMYQQYCAACHGSGGKGNGPAAKALTVGIPDLTTIAKEHNGEFPVQRIMETLRKGTGAGAHGSADMPVWGEIFSTSWQTDSQVSLRIYNLTRYIEMMQEPVEHKAKPVKVTTEPTPKYVRDVRPSSGADMYRWYCASCHGTAGTGDGPSAASLSTRPSDLTIIAKNNSGSFPTMRISNLLGATPGTEAHGSKEMPVWGDAFRAAREDNNIVQMRIHNLVAFLRSIQK